MNKISHVQLKNEAIKNMHYFIYNCISLYLIEQDGVKRGRSRWWACQKGVELIGTSKGSYWFLSPMNLWGKKKKKKGFQIAKCIDHSRRFIVKRKLLNK